MDSRNRSEFNAHAGLKAAAPAMRRAAARKPAAPRFSPPLSRALRLAAVAVAVVIIATEAAPHVARFASAFL